jgi:hypothetical protein
MAILTPENGNNYPLFAVVNGISYFCVIEGVMALKTRFSKRSST